jgi:hypothetical protein
MVPSTGSWQLILSSFDRWLIPIIALWLWTLLDPVLATAHTQILYLHVFGLWLGRWCHRRWNEAVGVWMEHTGFKTGVDEIQLRGGTVYRSTLGKQIEARGYLVAYWTIGGLFDLTLCLILGSGWLVFQLSWLCAWWVMLGPTLYSDDLAPYFWSLVYYFVGPWLIVACNYFAHRLSNSVDLQDSANQWYQTAFVSPCLTIAPDTASLKSIRLSLNWMVLFCLLLAKCAV